MRRAVDIPIAIGLATLAVFLLVRWMSLPSSHVTPVLGLGTVFEIPKRSLGRVAEHIVVVLSPTCAVCNHEARKYSELRRVLGQRSQSELIVVAAEPLDEVRPWLIQHSIRPNTLVRVPRLARLGIKALPTVLILDDAGFVTDIVVGLMNEELWSHFVQRVVDRDETPVNVHLNANRITEAEFGASPFKDGQVLDIRDRGTYAKGHRPGALSIPKDEIEVRVPIELSRERPLALDCVDGADVDECGVYAALIGRLGFSPVAVIVPTK